MEWALPEDPEDPNPEKLEEYVDLTLEGVEPLTKTAMAHRTIYGLRTGAKWEEPETLFYFSPGDQVLLRRKIVGKLEAKQAGPFTVKDVKGKYG
jgi:hypothetical protein